MSTEQVIAGSLLQISAIKLSPEEPFIWASGMKSPIYCDNRKTLSYPTVRSLIKNSFAEIVRNKYPDVQRIVGVATAGIAHGALLADALSLPFAYVRSKPKGHGMQNLIEGVIEANDQVVVVEDLISTGMSSLKAVDAVREVGAHVLGLVAIFTYGLPKSVKAFKEADCEFTTLSNYPALLQEAERRSMISKENLATLKDWQQDPQAWSDANV